MGGKNPFLGIAYVAVKSPLHPSWGIIYCYAYYQAKVYYYIHLINLKIITLHRKLGDDTYISWIKGR